MSHLRTPTRRGPLGIGPLGIGMIGAGMIGQAAHLANFIEIADCRVVGLAELRPRLARRAADRFGVPNVYGSHAELLANPDVEAVVVVTRRAATGPIVLQALRAGRHVLSEKPMAHTRRQAEVLADAARAAGVRYAVGFMKRHDAGVQHAKALLDGLIASGDLGPIVLVRAYCYAGDALANFPGTVMTDEPRPEGLELWPEAPDWVPPDRVSDYAWFLNVNVHILNLVRYLFGRTPAVTSADLAHARGRLVGLDFGVFTGALEFAEVAFHDWREGVEILFEKGRLNLELPIPMLRNVPARVELYSGGPEARTIVPVQDWSWAFRRQAEAFVADVLAGREPLASGLDGVEDLRFAEAIWRRHLGLGPE